jgi:hypothetical protein
VSHATLTDRFRPGRSSETKEVSNEAITNVTLFLFEHLA